MAMLTYLNFDVLFAIASHIKTRRSLLSLALTCRTFRDIVIPTFLFECLDLVDGAVEPELIQRVCHRIAADGPAAGVAVRHLAISGSYLEQHDVLPHMQNIQSVFMRLYGMDPLSRPRILTEVSTKINLRHLELHHCCASSLELLRGLRGLHTLALGLSPPLYDVTRESALGNILLNSRDTLTSLTLGPCIWSLDVPSADPADDADLIWPRVQHLNIYATPVDEECPFNLTRCFPSARSFNLVRTQRTWLAREYNRPFVSRLTSLQGAWEDVKYVKDAGANLRNATITERLNKDYNPNEYLSSSLECLNLTLERNSPQEYLGQVAFTCPKMKYLSLSVQVYGMSNFLERLDAAVRFLPGLPLECLCIEWVEYISDNDYPLINEELKGCTKKLAELVSQLLPSLRVLSMEWQDGGVHQQRADDASQFQQISAEDGRDLVDYYKQQWMSV
ncbi:hypothetical protein BOTBODRAFT_364976 [Botryobasidium botryosum FD-172 SS1]|uniref:F-box domain-containing protein n=1 Tax=Botryobasidium botryosum (strain FD-172 SS1) TaxID=930990 RepID=A0A067MD39_BOTB1|nr:hypothetical protein BOTBODRAFT_364976 [Botryobasidium botryosum FD-172 SS1]